MVAHRLPLFRRSDGGSASGAQVESLDDARQRRDLRQIGDLARETGKTVRAIHLYEELGLLTPAGRSKGRFRLYGAESRVRIRWIAKRCCARRLRGICVPSSLRQALTDGRGCSARSAAAKSLATLIRGQKRATSSSISTRRASNVPVFRSSKSAVI